MRYDDDHEHDYDREELPPEPRLFGGDWGIRDFRLWLVGAAIVASFFWNAFAHMAGCKGY